MYLYRPKHCNAKGCTEYVKVTGGDPQDLCRRTIRNCIYCCPSEPRLFLSLISIGSSYIQQVRQALSSTQWGVKDLHFDYRVFTNQLQSLFKDPENPWVQNLLDWWNKCVNYYTDCKTFWCTASSQVCFTKVSRGGLEDVEDSSDDENTISVDDLLARAAKEPDSDIDISDEEAGRTGSPLSAGSALRLLISFIVMIFFLFFVMQLRHLNIRHYQLLQLPCLLVARLHRCKKKTSLQANSRPTNLKVRVIRSPPL